MICMITFQTSLYRPSLVTRLYKASIGPINYSSPEVCNKCIKIIVSLDNNFFGGLVLSFYSLLSLPILANVYYKPRNNIIRYF